jgi:hypothetical protein
LASRAIAVETFSVTGSKRSAAQRATAARHPVENTGLVQGLLRINGRESALHN